MKRILYLQSASDLTKLAEACLNLTPKVYLSGPRDLYLDIASTQKCLGGEAKVLSLLEDLLNTFQVRARLVLTDYEPWAKPLALGEQNILPSGKSSHALLKCPIERLVYCGDPLRLEEEISERERLTLFMRRVGIQSIEDFIRLSDLALIRRFGKPGLILKEWVEGERECCLPVFSPEALITEIIETDSETALEGLLFYLKQALIRMEARLYGRAIAAQQIKLTFHLEGAESRTRFLDLSSPLREAKALLSLLKEFLDGMQWEAPLERLEITLSQTIPYLCGQLSLFDKTENLFADLAHYVSRLRARYGKESVGFPEIRESFVPERALALSFPPSKAPPSPPKLACRPLFIFTQPVPYTLPRNFQISPSENLAADWWEEETVARRYFIADTPEGERLWIFFDMKKQQWFLHGTFD